jgi:hypothetical protein
MFHIDMGVMHSNTQNMNSMQCHRIVRMHTRYASGTALSYLLPCMVHDDMGLQDLNWDKANGYTCVPMDVEHRGNNGADIGKT